MSKKKSILEEARNADLAASGLNTTLVIRKLALGSVLDPDETALLTGIEDRKFRAVSYEIPYFDVRGKRVAYSRWKLLSVDEVELPMKYFQEEKTIPRAYYPPLIDWVKLAKDTKLPVVITEGEKKAACACLYNIPCIGLGGVWNWKSKKWSYDEIPDFDEFTWRGREVEICFDGDMSSNDGVAKAMIAFTATLLKRGARVMIRRLEKAHTQGRRPALDDYLVAGGDYQDIPITEAPQSEELSRLNEVVVYLRRLNAYAEVETGDILKGEVEVRRKFGTRKVTVDGGKQIPVTDLWCGWEHRRTLENKTYEPGRPRFYESHLNSWTDDGVKPKKGSVSILLDIIGELDEAEWFLRWLAYPVQHPGVKLHSAVMLWSIQQRTGKSLIGDVMRDIYGTSNSSKIDSEDLQSGGNDWVAGKQFVMGEEVLVSATRADLGTLKNMVTSDIVRINIKYVPRHSLPNRANFYFASNQPDALRLEKNDRRYFVAKLDKTRDDKFWDQADKWRAQGGAAAWRYYLENDVDISSFNPRSPAPMTEDKREMIYTSMNEIEQWCADLLSSPEIKFGDMATAMKKRDVFTVGQLLEFLPETLRLKGNQSLLGKALIKAGAISLPSPMRTGDGKLRRLIAIRNVDEWAKRVRQRNLWSENYDAGRPVAKTEEPKTDNVVPIRRKK